MHPISLKFISKIINNIIRYLLFLFMGIYVIVLITSCFGIPLSHFSPTEPLFSEDTGRLEQFSALSWEHPFGTDFYGYDLFSQFYAGIRTNFFFSLITSVIFLSFGVFLGIRLGYYSKNIKDFKRFIKDKNITSSSKWRYLSVSSWGRFFAYQINGNNFFNAVLNVFYSFPLLLLVLLMKIFLDGWVRSTNTKLAILMALFGLFSSPRLASMIIGKIKALRSEEFIQSSIALGLSDKQIIWKHILLNECKYILLFQAMYMMGQGAILEITLTYLNFGAAYPWVSWGAVLQSMTYAPVHIYIIFPVIFITLTIFMYMRLAEEIKIYGEKRSL